MQFVEMKKKIEMKRKKNFLLLLKIMSSFS